MRRTLLGIAVAFALVCCVVGAGAAQGDPERADSEEPRCGFDELEARMIGTRVSVISRVEPPTGELAVAAAATGAWQPIRIAVFTEDISNSSQHCTASGQSRPTFRGGRVTCSAADVLTREKKRVLLELLIPSAVQLHQERLNVQRENGNIVVSPFIKKNSICGQFSIPEEHMKTGVPDADFVLYMSAAPTSGSVIAWAVKCQSFDNGRPSVGVATISPKYITAEPKTVRVVAHEVLHALGFTRSVFKQQNMLVMASFRGKSPSPVIRSANVVAQAQLHYGCKTQASMELEDEGGKGTVSSHWKRRSAKDELMAGFSGVGVYSALTIAAMEDTGYYQGNYAKAEPMAYGHEVGCKLSSERCVIKSTSQIPGMFCDAPDAPWSCTSDRRGIGRCILTSYKSNLPTYFQYFGDPRLGGPDPLMDFCPFVRAADDTMCAAKTNALKGSVYGVMSRCVDTPAGFSIDDSAVQQHGICAEVQCGSSAYGVKINGASAFRDCPPGSTYNLSTLSPSFSKGHLVCPSYESVCAININASLYEEYSRLLTDHSVTGARTSVTAVVAVLLVVLFMG
ncbi:putative leishmanolysin [Leishmania infantum JPCM5]|uniref:Leishmanolysin n=2 Tax=Leishmania infantum TaxID=5671 RepID=A0A6L0XHY8_LEIIN|nr:putative leishmanolysin [Leishmania infantum JPCM5]XP_003392668.1 putative leishmanolysin [Leishmania infantum JPCM5]CAC9502068.1 major_surface_protease_gp63_-_putative [Leishmania infantum]CAC9502080.1 major_surface_protease_gp63_-_putative [Leishmania infantum]CBZ08848.1 putative leishmanolysin [Leishmania infantum JPCM5]CBZ08849.1 putative leishmanolysin [Leishmania infantum JPCM5]SUZ43220.1 major_surface_protease_gp63_-_putative [Leishmania infantum]|eukprot:XP_003392667.1 putative leishmanolysin [Leishmania infantum JPCM5]